MVGLAEGGERRAVAARSEQVAADLLVVLETESRVDDRVVDPSPALLESRRHPAAGQFGPPAGTPDAGQHPDAAVAGEVTLSDPLEFGAIERPTAREPTGGREARRLVEEAESGGDRSAVGVDIGDRDGISRRGDLRGDPDRYRGATRGTGRSPDHDDAPVDGVGDRGARYRAEEQVVDLGPVRVAPRELAQTQRGGETPIRVGLHDADDPHSGGIRCDEHLGAEEPRGRRDNRGVTGAGGDEPDEFDRRLSEPQGRVPVPSHLPFHAAGELGGKGEGDGPHLSLRPGGSRARATSRRRCRWPRVRGRSSVAGRGARRRLPARWR